MRIVIDFDQASGELKIQAPADLAIVQALLERTRQHVAQQVLAPQAAVQVAPAGILDRLNGKG